jgi:raffinose/stachyose/melibiose transport system permease protein
MKSTTSTLLKLLVALLVGAVILIPLILIILNSLKSAEEAARFNLALPKVWHWANYKVAFVDGGMLVAFFNSMIITVLSVSIVVFAGSSAAYILSRRQQERGMKAVYLIVICGLIAPPSFIPTIKLMQAIHLNGQYMGVVLVFCAILFPFAIFTMTGFIKSIPRELDEAAIVDGSSGIIFYTRIMFPLLLPAIATVTIFVFMRVWNDFQWPLYLLNTSAKWPLPLSVFNFVSKYDTEWQYVFANLFITISPVLLLYFFLQRYIIEGMTAGSVKG